MATTLVPKNIVLDWLRIMQLRCSSGYRRRKPTHGCSQHRSNNAYCFNCRTLL